MQELSPVIIDSNPAKVRGKSQSSIDYIIADHALETLPVMYGFSDHFALVAKVKNFQKTINKRRKIKKLYREIFQNWKKAKKSDNFLF